jgi:hypothetical protein
MLHFGSLGTKKPVSILHFGSLGTKKSVHYCDLGADEFVDAWFDTVSLFGFFTLFVLERNADIIRMPDIRSRIQH